MRRAISRRAALLLATAATFTAGTAMLGSQAGSARADAAVSTRHVRQPNVVVILADDLGWPDVSSYGQGGVPTPNIDRIGRTGVAFSDGYAAASVCAVSRAGLLTGRMPARFGFTYNINDSGETDREAGLPKSEMTLAERLKPLGYRTAAIGKWHQGARPQFYPTRRGFDEFFGFLSGETAYVDPRTPGIVTTPTTAEARKPPIDRRRGHAGIVMGADARPVANFDKYLTTEITDHAVDFIDRAAGRPFFAYVAYNAPHWPLQVPQAWYDRFAHIQDPVRRTYVAMIAAMDEGVGRILDTLERKGVRDDTIVVFLSDNGCPAQLGFCNLSHPLGAGKFTYLEGGVRVPFLLSWPARLKPAGIVRTPVSALDVMPTVLRAAAPHAPLPAGLDGVDLVRTVEHPPARPRLLIWGQAPVFAARRGNLKFWQAEDRPEKDVRLFDLADDAWERTNLRDRRPRETDALQHAVDRWRRTLPAPLWPLHEARRVTTAGRETVWVY